MRWLCVGFFVVVGCGDSAGNDGPVSLTSAVGGINTRITGNGIDCGTSTACDGSRVETCSVVLEPGTRVSLHASHPVCPPGGLYFTFGWQPPCERSSGSDCEFTITEDTVVVGQGLSAVDSAP